MMEDNEDIQMDLVTLRENIESLGSVDTADGLFVLRPGYQDHLKFLCTLLRGDERTGGSRLRHLGKWEVARTHLVPMMLAYYDDSEVTFGVGVMISLMTTWSEQLTDVLHFQRQIKKQFCSTSTMSALTLVFVPLIKRWAADAHEGRDVQCLELYLCLVRNLLKISDDTKAIDSNRHIHDDFIVAMQQAKLTDLLLSFTHQAVVRKDHKFLLILLEIWHFFFILEKATSLFGNAHGNNRVDDSIVPENVKEGALTHNVQNNSSKTAPSGKPDVMSLLTSSLARSGPTKSRLGGGKIQHASILPGGVSRVQFGDDPLKRHNEGLISKAGRGFIFEQTDRAFSQVKVQQAVMYTLDRLLAPQPLLEQTKPKMPTKRVVAAPKLVTPAKIVELEQRAAELSAVEKDELAEEKDSWERHCESVLLRHQALSDEAERAFQRELHVYEHWDSDAELRKAERLWQEAQNSLSNLFLHEVRLAILAELTDGDENSLQDATYWCALSALVLGFFQRRWENKYIAAVSVKEKAPPLDLGVVLECLSADALEFVLNSLMKSMEKPVSPPQHIVSAKMLASQLGVCSSAYKYANETEIKVVAAYHNIVCSEKETLHAFLKSTRAYEPTKLPRSCLLDLFSCVDHLLSLYEQKHDSDGRIQVIGRSRKRKSASLNFVELNSLIEPFVHPAIVEHLMFALRSQKEGREYKSVVRILKRVLNVPQSFGLFFHIPYLMQMDEFFDNIKKNPKSVRGVTAEVNEIFRDISQKFITSTQKNPMLFIEALFTTTIEKVSFIIDPKQHIADTLGGNYISSSSFKPHDVDGVSEQTMYKLEQQRVRNVANIIHTLNIKNKRNVNQYSETMIHKLTTASNTSKYDDDGEDMDFASFNQKNNKIIAENKPVLREQKERTAKKKKTYKDIVDHTDDELSSEFEQYSSEYDINEKKPKKKPVKPAAPKQSTSKLESIPSHSTESVEEPAAPVEPTEEDASMTQIQKKRRIVVDSDEE